MKIRSLKTKVLIWFVGIISIVMCLFSFLVFYFVQESINLKIQNNMYYSARDMLDEIEEGDLDGITFKYELANHIQAAIIKDGKIIKQTKEFDIKDSTQYTKKDEIFFLEESTKDTVNAVYVLNFLKPFDGSIVLTKKNLHNKAEDIEDILFILNPIFLIILIFIGIKLVDKILIPIQNITNLAKQINIDNFSHSIDTTSKEDELRELSQTFNDMISRLKNGVERMDRFNSDVSHELRTPLTVIKTQAELTLKKDRDNEYYKNSLKMISQESDKIEQIVKELLLFTRYTKENISTTYSLCDLNTILLDTVEKLTPFSKDKNITIEILKFQKALYKANYPLMQILFSNIIDNAIKYTPNDKNIYISLFTENEKIVFEVKDEGIGIPKDELEKVYDRFYRVDESRNKTIKGFGLGLSIVKNIVQLHNMDIKIKSEESIGTTVRIEF